MSASEDRQIQELIDAGIKPAPLELSNETFLQESPLYDIFPVYTDEFYSPSYPTKADEYIADLRAWFVPLLEEEFSPTNSDEPTDSAN